MSILKCTWQKIRECPVHLIRLLNRPNARWFLLPNSIKAQEYR